MVATFLAWMAEQKYKASTIDLALASIADVHVAASHPSPRDEPFVRDARRGIRRSIGTARSQKTAVLPEDLCVALRTLPRGLVGFRDRALLLFGFASALRRSELVALDVEDLAEERPGLRIRVRRSKTDQEGAACEIGIPRSPDQATCPVDAVSAWLQHARVSTGPLFRRIDRHGNVSPERLSDRSVALVVKRAMAASGLEAESFAGHSLRAGLATAAARAGVPERVIARQTGHRSMEVLRSYVRQGDLWLENAATGLL